MLQLSHLEPNNLMIKCSS